MRLKTKLIATFLATGIIPLTIISIVSIILESKALEEKAFNQLVTVREIKKAQIKSFFAKRLVDIRILADSPFIQQAMEEIDAAFNTAGGTKGGKFKGHTNEKYDAPTEYRKVHDKYFANLKFYIEEHGYYDLFLMSPDFGDTSFTVTKESDFGQRASIISSSLADMWEKATKEDKTALSDTRPYPPSDNIPAQFVAAPIRKNGKLIGVVALQLSTGAINKIMQQRDGMGETGETYLVGPDRLMRSDSYLDPDNHSVIASFANPAKGAVDTEATRELFSGKTNNKIVIDYIGNSVLSAYAPLQVGENTWGIIAEIDEAEAFATIQNLQLISIITIIISIAIIAAIVFIMAGSITRPVLMMVDYSKGMAGGDFTQSLDIQQSDEIGEMATALNTMSDNLSSMIREINDNTISLESSSTKLSSIAGQMASSSDSTVEKSISVSAAAEEMNVNMSSVASAMEQASSNMDTVASANEEMNNNINGIVKEVEMAGESTKNAVIHADKVANNVQTLGRDAEEIGTVTETIASISDKTNLLALNATIEAARAGEAGKGFAVVASEIKELANQTATATTDIGNKLKGIQNSSGVAVAGIEEISGSIKGINEVVASISDTMNQQSSMIGEITENVNQTSVGIREINQNISQTSEAASQVASEISVVNDSAGEVSNSTAQLSQSAEDLSLMASRLKEKMEQFKV